MAFFEDERLATRFQEFRIALEHRRRGVACVDRQFVLPPGEDGARHEPHKIDDIGHLGDFVEVIHPPNQPSFLVAPRTEILHVQIAHRKNPRSLDDISTDLREEGPPAIERPAQEGEKRACHLPMLEADIRLHDIDLATEPILVIEGRSDNPTLRCSHARLQG